MNKQRKYLECKNKRLKRMKWFCLIARLIIKAKERHGENIIPVGGRPRFENGLCNYGGKLCLWYDTPDESTHIVWEDNICTEI